VTLRVLPARSLVPVLQDAAVRWKASESRRVAPAALYLGGKFGSQLGQNALLAALLLTAGTSERASIGLSTFFVAMLIPSVLLGPLGGAVVDRIGPARGYALGALLRGLAVVPALALIDSPHMVWVVAAMYSAASQVFTPAEFSLVPHVQGSRPGRMYSALTTLQYAGQGTGLLLFAPALFFIGGQAGVFAGVIAVFGLLSLVGLALVLTGTGQAAPNSVRGSAVSVRAAARFLFLDSRAFYAMVALAISGTIMRALVVSIPAYMREEVSVGPLGMLFIIIPGAAGILAGLLWTSRTLSLERSSVMLRLSSLGLLGALFVLAFVDHGVTILAQSSAIPPIQTAEAWVNTTALVVVPAAFAVGAGMCIVVMSARFVLTELAPAGSQGRVHAVQLAVTEAILVVPILCVGVTTSLAGARPTLAIVGAIALGTLAATERRRAARRLAEVREALHTETGHGLASADSPA
jgi:hypothetical protein